MTAEEFLNIPTDQPGFLQLTGMSEYTLLEDGRLSMTVPVTEKLINPLGITHGGAIFTLCDNLAGGYFHHQGKVPVTLSSNIVFHTPSRLGDVLTGIVNCRKEGRKTGVLLIEVFNQNHDLVAEDTVVMYFVK